MDSIKLFAPATSANISCGFDVLGLCLDNVGDEMIISKTPNKGEVTISKIIGQDLPLDVKKNVAGVAVLALLEKYGEVDCGFDIIIDKKIKPGSGLGSSAASSAGAVYGVNKLLGEPFTDAELIPFAMEGERLVSGVAHADNVAPALLGGFTLVRSYTPLDVIKIHTPEELFITVIHPQIEIKTADSRAVLKDTVSLKDTITQMGNLGGLISGLYSEDFDLISRSLEDVIVEPLRSVLIPNFYNVKKNALEAGALGSSISGSGPSIFALSKGKETADKVAKAMAEAYEGLDIDFDVHVSKLNQEGNKIID